MAINGDGFFSVQKATSVVDNVPVFSGVTDYTRRGDFQVNANGNLINGAGYYLMGVTVDAKTGNPTGNVPQVLQFKNNFIPAQATTNIQYGANLPTKPKTPASSGAPPNSLTAAGGLNPADFVSNPLPLGTPATPFSNNTITGNPASNLAAPTGPITAATTLSGTAPSNSLATSFVAGDKIIVDGTTINILAAGPLGPNDVLTTDTVGTLLGKIQGITGGPAPTIDPVSGAITLNTGTAANLNITSTAAGFGALGFASPVTQIRNGGGTAGGGVVIGTDATAFTNESISGGAVTTFNSAGTPINVQLRWAKTDSATLGAGHQDVWNLFYQTNTTATGATVGWVNAGTNFVFNSSGVLTSPTGPGVTIPGVVVDGQTLGPLTVNLSAGALTQFASTSGSASINNISQNGFAAGQLQSVAINNSGLVVGTFSNGQNIDLASVTLSHFNGTNYLKSLDGGAYEVTELSGPAIAGASGKISGSSLEGSNTDIADEFTKLIVTQQAYSANTKVITTANSMVQDLLNVLR
jgi:flagellar hook protein FlgE